MESQPFHITDPTTESQPAAEPQRPRTGRASARPDERRRDTPVRVRLGLQHRAQINLRRHLTRAIQRFTVLLVADLASFGAMRALLRAVRDHAVLGADVAAALWAVLPPGMLNGWQFASALLVGLVIMGTYGPGDRRRDPRRLFAAVALAAALALWTAIWSRGLDTVLVEYALTVTLVWAGLVAERMTVESVVAWVRPPARDAAKALFVGPAKACREAAASAAFTSGVDYQPIGFVDSGTPAARGAVGHIGDFELIVAATGAEVVVVCGHLTDGQFSHVVEGSLAAGCQVLSVPRAVGTAGVHPMTVWRNGQPLVALTRPALKGRQLLLKRALDLTVSLSGLVVLAPVFAAIWAAIKLDSRGSGVFGHARLGLNARVFRCLKFRSMHMDAEGRLRADLPLYGEYMRNNYKLPEGRDPRLTRVGRWLRRLSLDELPQLVNVARGDMSLVGPRPIVPDELSQYGPGAATFLSLKPGMTGAWAVNGRSRVGYPHRADIELDYVRQWSLGRDLWILLRTFRTVLVGEGAE